MATLLERHNVTVTEAKLSGRDSYDFFCQAAGLSEDVSTFDAQAVAARGQVLDLYNDGRERYVALLLQTAEHLVEVAKRVAADPVSVPNSRGELRGRTSEIEGTGATLTALLDVLHLCEDRVTRA